MRDEIKNKLISINHNLNIKIWRLTPGGSVPAFEGLFMEKNSIIYFLSPIIPPLDALINNAWYKVL